jgi:hypothetical protein
MKNTWQGYIVAILTSLILGGGGTFLLNNSRISAMERTFSEEIVSLKIKDEKNFEIIIEMAKGIVRIEEQVKYMQKVLDGQ